VASIAFCQARIGEIPSASRGANARFTQVLVDGFAADAVVVGEDDFWDAVFGSVHEFGGPFRCEGLLSSLVGSALFGQRNPFALTFPDQGAFEFCEGAHDGEHQVGHGRVVAGEDQALFYELDTHAPAREALDESTEVIKVPRKAVHTVHDQSIPVTGEAKQLGKLWPGGIPAGGLIHEYPVKKLAIKLAFFILFQRAHPYVPDPLSAHSSLQHIAWVIEVLGLCCTQVKTCQRMLAGRGTRKRASELRSTGSMNQWGCEAGVEYVFHPRHQPGCGCVRRRR